MSAINFQALDGVFTRTEPERIYGDGSVHRFQLNPRARSSAIATAINTLLQDNPDLILVSKPRASETLAAKVARCPHLTINGDAVCLSDKTKGPDLIDRLVKDVFFSEALIEEPIRCGKEHVFEREHIVAWVEETGDFCPCKGDHPVGPLHPDPYFADRVKTIIKAYKHQENTNINAEKTLKETKKVAEENKKAIKIAEKTVDILHDDVKKMAKHRKRFEMSMEAGDGVVQAASIIGPRLVDPNNAYLKGFSSQIPGISLALGCALAAHRCWQGYITNDKTEYAKAAIDIAKGIVQCFPGYGTVLGMGLNMAMVSYDIYQTYGSQGTIHLTVQNAHNTLGLNPDEKITKEEIDKNFRKLSKLAHPDTMGKYGGYTEEELTHLQTALAEAKNVLYNQYGYAAPQKKRKRESAC